jgi:hypothetical protein
VPHKFFFTFVSKNNKILQLGTILNNEASVLESFFQIFGMAGRYFLELSANPYSWKELNKLGFERISRSTEITWPWWD